MASLSDFTAALAVKFEPAVTETLNRAVVLPQVLKTTAGRAHNINWAVRTGTALPATGGGSIGDGTDVPAFQSDAKVKASLEYATYHEAFSLTGKAMAGAAATGNPEELAALWGEENQESIETLAARVNSAAFTGDGSTDEFAGLTATNGALKATGTYAGLSRVTYPTWAGNELLNGGTPRDLSLTLMRTMRRTIYEACGYMVDLIVAPPIQFDKYGALMGAERRYLQEVTLRGKKIVLDGGFHALEFDGIPIIQDQFCPDGVMCFLNTRHVEFKYLPDAPAALTGAMGYYDLHGSEEEQVGNGGTGLMARMQPLAVDGDLFKYSLYLYPQIVNKRPNATGLLGDLTTS